VLADRGHTILQIYSRTLEKAQKLAEKTGCFSTNNFDWLNKDADIYILTVKDDSIQQIASSLQLPGKLVLHTSGSVPMTMLSTISENTGVLYPLQTFTKDRPVNWREIPLCIEASNLKSYSTLKTFASSISEVVQPVDSDTRKHVHLAAVFVNNFTNFLYGQALSFIPDKLPLTLLKPLAEETIRKAFELGPQQAQTGPAIRGDLKTIAAHEEMLQEHPVALQVYKMLTDMISANKS
jgi:predicted short-subunit dehydrogenase-like oxidoreductase (DUF2520 family)